MLAISRLILIAVVACPFGHHAQASCIGGVHPTLYVGSDNKCNYAAIQTAINAVSTTATCSPNIVISGRPSWTEHLIITDRSLTLIGNTGNCRINNTGGTTRTDTDAAHAAVAKVKIDGSANQGTDVIDISGNSNVALLNLEISGGNSSSRTVASAGGVTFNGTGSLTLQNVEVHANHGDAGGGVAFFGSGTLRLDGASIHDNIADFAGGGVSVLSSAISNVEFILANSTGIATDISSNQATVFGGGIFASGATHLLAVATAPGDVVIHDNSVVNTATHVGTGGGIFYSGSTFADIALPAASIQTNHADYGGGIAIATSSAGDSMLRLFSTNAAFPTALNSNTATVFGGGIYLSGGSSTRASACLFDAALIGNSSGQYGSAIYLNGGGRLLINPDADSQCSFANVAALGGVHCDSSASNCNLISQNFVASGSVQTIPATIDFIGAASINAQRVRLSQNTGVSVIRSNSATGDNVVFSNCLIDHNTVSNALVSLQGAPATFDGCTFADDNIAAPTNTVFAYDTGLTLQRSIVHESIRVLTPAAALVAQYLILNDPRFATDATVLYSDPDFVNSAASDYHLLSGSPAIDFAPTGADGGSGDFDRQPRVVDIPGIANSAGIRDLGAYEYQLGGVLDRIFSNGFE
ncbi:hypothetical protein ELE36_14385 [Pseudolysobacter antarcticus]|uniref:Right-handed parallel beta-helix repeat-containing protein n=1 Tax=Pseudolysobacter antarcticus TaxID=2511995 RepID=A0A411HLP4_9GAMM|nr:hypothetical protein [Pseudolysobacter antarcticus]QBB71449.1 hypothetical protein ELE36_14385 [Pseudolysobacter antarcticus]